MVTLDGWAKCLYGRFLYLYFFLVVLSSCKRENSGILRLLLISFALLFGWRGIHLFSGLVVRWYYVRAYSIILSCITVILDASFLGS